MNTNELKKYEVKTAAHEKEQAKRLDYYKMLLMKREEANHDDEKRVH